MKTLVLIIVCFIAKVILFPFLTIWSVYRSLEKGEFLIWLKSLEIAFDRFGNCLGKYPFNDLLGVGFGNSKETVSSRLGKNEVDLTAKKMGGWWIKKLNNIEKNHCIKAIDKIV